MRRKGERERKREREGQNLNLACFVKKNGLLTKLTLAQKI